VDVITEFVVKSQRLRMNRIKYLLYKRVYTDWKRKPEYRRILYSGSTLEAVKSVIHKHVRTMYKNGYTVFVGNKKVTSIYSAESKIKDVSVPIRIRTVMLRNKINI
jgi:hypothetical protein